jgi:hypothetical protein
MPLEPYQIVRELLAGSLFFLNVYLFWSFAANVSAFKALRSWKCWRNDPAAQGAVALATYFFGALILRGWDWCLYVLNNLNIDFHYSSAGFFVWMIKNSWGVTIVAGAIVMLGGLCCVRVFNPQSRANWMLAVVAVFSTLMPFGLHFLIFGWPA